jgi:hypothetical protein
MALKPDDKKTTSREALTCLAISYFALKGLSSSLQEFSGIIHKYFFENNEGDISRLTSSLSIDFKLNRIKELYKSIEDALAKSGSGDAYSAKQFQIDFPNGKNYTAEDGSATKLDAEIKSAYSTAQILQTSSLVGNLSQYKIFDQSSEFMKIVKDDALNTTIKALELSSSVGSDILSSVDIMLVRSSKLTDIKNEFEKHIIDADQMTILNNLAYGDTGKNTYRTLTNKYFSNRDMIGISLKKVPSNRDANLKIIGTVAGAGELKLYLDPYTEFLAKVDQLKSKSELFKLIDDMVEIVKIGSTDPRAYFVVDYKLNYKAANITDKVEKINLQIGRSGFNATTPGQLGFVGGASYAVTLPVLQRYPRYNQMVREVISIREKAFNYAIVSKKVPSNLQDYYNKAFAKIKKNVLVLYDAEDNIIIKQFCTEYDKTTKNTKDSFQEYRIAVSKLCKNKSLTSPDSQLRALDKNNFKTSGVPKTLHNDYVHSQGLYMYTRQGEDLKKFFKKQISLTIYGIMAKKGGRVFYSKQKDVLTEDAFVKEFKAKNNKNKLAKVVVAPYILIS